MTDITAIILTKNEEVNIERCIKSLNGVVDRICVVDSGSTDHTIEIAKNLGAEIFNHEPFNHYAAQFNWALDNVGVKTTWVYRIDAVLGTVLEKQQKEIVTTDFISLEEAKEIALKDAGLNEATQKIVFTREELSRNQGKPCYILEFYTDKCAYSYKVDAVSGDILEKNIEWRSLQESEPVSETVQSSDSNQRRIG